VVVLMILSLNFSAAGAQQEPPKVYGIAVAPVPLKPQGAIYVKWPEFTFSRNFSATRYAIQVRNSETDELLYTYKGVVPCNGDTCKLTPATRLPYYDHTGDKGNYKWRVRAKIGVSWQNTWSDYMAYISLSPGFTSTFSTFPKKWTVLKGDWLLNTDQGYVKTPGEINEFSSMVYRDLFSHENGLVYEVIMKRKQAVEDFNVAVVMGHTNLNHDDWDYDGPLVHFMYNNAGDVMLINLRNPSDPPLLNINSPWIKPYDWNKLTIWVHDTFASLWINEQYITTKDLGIFFGDMNGCVGVGMWKSAFEKSPLLVDEARAYYLDEPPYLVP